MDNMNAALAEMAYALDVLELDGVYADTHLAGKYLGDASYDPWFEEMNRRGVTLFVHPTAPPGFDGRTSRMNVSVLEFMFDSTRMVTHMVLSGAKQRFAGIRIISTHGGGTIPYLAQRISMAGAFPWAYPGGPKLTPPEILAALGSFHFDLTASTGPASLDALLRLVPAERLLMGFDFPLMPPQSIAPAKEALDSYPGLSDEQRRAIASGNASRLFARFQTGH
jgi:predicted TIM-barrel fold metal-dependent hydrolase